MPKWVSSSLANQILSFPIVHVYHLLTVVVQRRNPLVSPQHWLYSNCLFKLLWYASSWLSVIPRTTRKVVYTWKCVSSSCTKSIAKVMDDYVNIFFNMPLWHSNFLLLHCNKGKFVLTQFGYLMFIVKHSGVPLPALDSTQIKNLIWFSRTLVNVMGECFANEIVQSCGKGYETEVTKMG